MLKTTTNPILDPTPKKDRRRKHVSLKTGFRHKRRARRRDLKDFRTIANAVEQLEELPADGWSIHAICKGNFHTYDLIPATIKLAESKVLELSVVTLGFNSRQAEGILGLIDDGQVDHCTFICADVYPAHEPDLCRTLADGLDERGGTFAALRSHCKLILIRTEAGHHLTFESSANLRSCRKLEQFVLTNCAELYRFHRGWIEEAIATDGTKEKAGGGARGRVEGARKSKRRESSRSVANTRTKPGTRPRGNRRKVAA